MITAKSFATKMLKFYDELGRKDLPWQQNKTGYSVWVSEIMLQQTQVKTVIPYYLRFIRSFPSIKALAKADIDSVLHHWAGLGYYSRARNLHACAKRVVDEFDGEFPQQLDEIVKLPGIGESTGGAILSLAYGQSEAILDGNVKRVLARVFLVDGWYGKSSVAKELWHLSRTYTPKTRTGDFNQAMMDLGASLCARNNPICSECPLSPDCQALLQNKTKEYPHRKPNKAIPTKQATMLLGVNRSKQIQLVKRPPSGIWGGLWSLPELEPPQVKSSLASNKKISDEKMIGQFKHTFSHFHLEVDVIDPNQLSTSPVDIKTGIMVEENTAVAWHNIDQLTELALPTPIKKFLYRHFHIKEK